MTDHPNDIPRTDVSTVGDGVTDVTPDGTAGPVTRSDEPRDRAKPTEDERPGVLAAVGRTLKRVIVDLVVITLWVLALTATFLATAWPRWSFYALLVGGIVGYTWVTR